jgi:two-component system chemotaxis sensor kinase CheA
MNELLNEFLVESYENMDQYEGSLIELEKDPTSKKLVSAIFRTLHTVKGTCGFLGLSRLEAIAHAGENLLSLVRDGVVNFNQAIASALLATGDAVRAILAQLEKTETEGDVDYSELVALLVSLQKPVSEGAVNVEESAKPAKAVSTEAKAAPVEAKAVPAEAKAAPAKAPVKLAPAAKAPTAEPEPKVVKAPVEAPMEVSAAKVQPTASTASTAKSPEGDSPSGSKASDSTVRVNVELLDRLMNLVGELVLTRNQIVQLTGSLESVPMQAACHRLNHITTELQDRMMKTRVQPIDALWSKLPRTVRDLAQLCGKQIRLETEGAETELDRTVIEAIKDPMTHLLRNSVDHGVESPEERRPRARILRGAFFCVPSMRRVWSPLKSSMTAVGLRWSASRPVRWSAT